MSMTVDSIASQYYNQYAVDNSKTCQPYSADASTVTKERYDISDLTNALSAAASSNNVNLNISSMNQYAQNTFETSQLSEYDTLKSMESSLGLSDSVSGSAQTSYLESRLGMNLNTAGFLGITNLDSYSQMQYEASKLSPTSDSLSNYQSGLAGLAAGNLLDQTG